jgi:uncharacterized protein with HEPN domain
MRVDAVVRNFEVTGEAVKNLSDEPKAQFPDTDWKAVAGFRDTLIHAISASTWRSSGILL